MGLWDALKDVPGALNPGNDYSIWRSAEHQRKAKARDDAEAAAAARESNQVMSGLVDAGGVLRGAQEANIDELRALAQGEGPSVAAARGRALGRSAMAGAQGAMAEGGNSPLSLRAASYGAGGTMSRGAGEIAQQRALEGLRARELLGQAVKQRFDMDKQRLEAIGSLMESGLSINDMPTFSDQLLQGGSQAVAMRYGGNGRGG